MKLINENLTRFKLILFVIIIIIELIAFIIVINLYQPIYRKTFELTKNYTINKTVSATESIKDVYILSFNRYLCDLKLIGKHMAFLGNETDDNKYINRSSNYYQNILLNEDKQIVYGTMEELKKITHLYKNYFSEEKNKFDYSLKYYKDYFETGKESQIINYLNNNSLHPELNMIAYYKLKGNTNVDLLTDSKKRAAKYLISILKANFIKRLITRGKNFEFMNYILFVEDEMYIYPPEAFNNTHIFYISNLNQFNCPFFRSILFFPKCVYEAVIKREKNYVSSIPGYIQPVVIGSKIYYDKISLNFCMGVPFEKYFDLYNLTYYPFLCQESNLTKFFLGNIFEQKEGFEFITFYINLMTIKDIVPFFNVETSKYEEIKKVFDDEKFQKYSINSTMFPFDHYSLFHFLYLDIFKDKKNYNKLTITIDEIIKEYEEIMNKILIELEKLKNNTVNNNGGGLDNEHGPEIQVQEKYKVIEIEKTICKSDIYNNNITCLKDSFLYIIYPVHGDFNLINEYFLDDPTYPIDLPFLYILSIINNNNKYMEWKIKNIMKIKVIKLFLFYFIVTSCVILFYFILIRLFFETRYNVINQILEIINNGLFFEMKDKNEIIQKKESILIEPNNKDMIEVKDIFDTLTKSMLLKINFDKKNLSFNAKFNKNRSNSKIKNKSHNQFNLDSLKEYIDLIKSINNPEIKIMSIFIISYDHFKKRLYNLAENDFKNLLLDMNIYENKLSNKNDDNDSKLKDSLSRCSKISYLNEYSLTNEMNETTLPIIKAKLLKQKILYLYALCIYNQEKSKKNNKENKNINNENIKKRYEEAIKYFTESKNISSLLGTDTIREIFSLIMISKCYIELKNYKESMININEALLLYTDLQKSFKDKAYFNPKIMLFTENYIFQSIMLSMAQATYSFNKYPQSCWILMKIIEASPFIFNDIHYNACLILNKCLRQLESNYNIPLRQLDKYRKNINKICSRINIKLLNNERINEDYSINNINNNNTNTNKNIASNPSISQVNSLNIVGNYSGNIKKIIDKKDYYTNKLNNASITSPNVSNKNKYKNITLCISEKVIMNINGEELKDVIIKFFQKCFSNNSDEDKFSFIQFSYNGKKTISIKSEPLDIFLQKLESNKEAFQIIDNYNKSSIELQFMEFSNLFFSIIKSQKKSFDDKNDNIIIIFINSEDIRFNGKKECVDTINELNNNNYTLIIFTYDTLISNEKIMNIHSFLCGLNDGHFFQIKNYQQIKQILMNFSVKESQEKFVNYDYEITDYML